MTQCPYCENGFIEVPCILCNGEGRVPGPIKQDGTHGVPVNCDGCTGGKVKQQCQNCTAGYIPDPPQK